MDINKDHVATSRIGLSWHMGYDPPGYNPPMPPDGDPNRTRTEPPLHPFQPITEETAPSVNIKEMGTTNVPEVKNNIHTLTIIGQVEGHLTLPAQNKTTKYEHVIPQLIAVEQNRDIEGLVVILNTVGGDVEAGLAIAEMIHTLSKPSVSLVLGGGHSIGVPIAVATNHSYIAHSATMTIHPIRLSGLVIGVPQTYEYLDKMQDRVVRFVVENSRISEERYRELMFRTGELARDIGTVLVGEEAIKEGLIDEVGGVAHAIRKLNELIKQKNNRGDLN